MSNLEYSIDAKNVLAKFYGVEKMLYVEGDDDVLFWEFMFEKFKAPKIEIQALGGKNEVLKYIDQIKSGELLAFIALDNDFTLFEDNPIKHTSIITTAGYSIENTLINPEYIMKTVRAIGKIKSKEASITIAQDWINEFNDKVTCLLINDVVDQICGERNGVVPDNCDRFFKSKNSYEICSEKITSYLNSIGLNENPEIPEKLKTRIEELNFQTSDFIRGHFIFSAALRFVSRFIESKKTKVSIPISTFFGALILAFSDNFDDAHHHYNHYKKEFSRLRA